MALLDERRDVHDKTRPHIRVQARIDDLEWSMRRRVSFDLGQPGKETGFVPKRRHDRMIRMAGLPVGKNHHARAQMTQHADDLQAVVIGVLDAPVGHVQRLSPAHTEYPPRFVGFARPVFGGTATAGFPAGQVEDGRTQAARRHAKQSSAAGLLHVVAVRCDGENVGGEGSI